MPAKREIGSIEEKGASGAGKVKRKRYGEVNLRRFYVGEVLMRTSREDGEGSGGKCGDERQSGIGAS